MAKPLPISTAFKFNGRNVPAQEHANRLAAQFVTRVSEETRQAINTMIVRAIRDGITPYETSRLIKAIVGLTSPHAAAVTSYYQKMLEDGADPVRAQDLADRYADKLITSRSKTIARTEIMGALNGGALEQARQRTEEGIFTKPMKKWHITPDEMTCRICRPLSGKSIPLESVFPNGVTAPPAHPNCRCSLSFYEGSISTPRPEPLPPVEGKWSLTGQDRRDYAKWLLANREKRKPR